jgi:hypothetical protein
MPEAKQHYFSLSLLLVFGLLALGSSDSSDRSTPEQQAQANCEDKISAFVMSQQFVKDRLKAPATADFPSIADSGVSVNYLGDCTHAVRAFVDAQNSGRVVLSTDDSASQRAGGHPSRPSARPRPWW